MYMYIYIYIYECSNDLKGSGLCIIAIDTYSALQECSTTPK